MDVVLQYYQHTYELSPMVPVLYSQVQRLIMAYGRPELCVASPRVDYLLNHLISGFYHVSSDGIGGLPTGVMNEIARSSLDICDGCEEVVTSFLFGPCDQCDASYVHHGCTGCDWRVMECVPSRQFLCCHECDRGIDVFDMVYLACSDCMALEDASARSDSHVYRDYELYGSISDQDEWSMS